MSGGFPSTCSCDRHGESSPRPVRPVSFRHYCPAGRRKGLSDRPAERPERAAPRRPPPAPVRCRADQFGRNRRPCPRRCPKVTHVTSDACRSYTMRCSGGVAVAESFQPWTAYARNGDGDGDVDADHARGRPGVRTRWPRPSLVNIDAPLPFSGDSRSVRGPSFSESTTSPRVPGRTTRPGTGRGHVDVGQHGRPDEVSAFVAATTSVLRSTTARAPAATASLTAAGCAAATGG